MELKIATRDKSLKDEIFETFSGNRKIELREGVEIELRGVEFKKGLDFPEIAALVITVAQHVPAALAAELIKDWIKPFHRRSETITLDEEEITFGRDGKPRKIVRRHIKKERK